MGGLGSGCQIGRSTRGVTSTLLSIDIRSWQRAGKMSCTQGFIWHWTFRDKSTSSILVEPADGRVVLSYRQRRGSEKEANISQEVELTRTNCHLGGRRAWFVCPAVNCGRRVAILYLEENFACRRCCQLAYRSQRETVYGRALRRLSKTRERLGWPQGVLSPSLGRPKGMHQLTYCKLTDFHSEQAMAVLEELGKRIGTVNQSLDSLKTTVLQFTRARDKMSDR